MFNLHSDKFKKKYYVLACLEKNRFEKINKEVCFETALENLLPIEVFITDYDFLRPLDYYDKLRKRNYTFKKYGISEFCKILDEHMFKSTKTLSVISNGQYKCSIVSNQTLLQIGKIHRDSGSVSSLFVINSLSCFYQSGSFKPA